MNAWQSKSTREELGRKSLIMDWQSPRNKKWIRILALILTVCFVNQDLVWAQGGTPVWSKGQSGSFALRPQDSTPQGGMSVPRDIAVTKEVYNSAIGDKTIINIQDAHASLAAQESIVSILDSLVTNYDLKLVAIEGSQGYIDTSILRTFPDEEIRKKTAKYFMKKGKLSAGEFFSITSDKEVALYGIEDKPLYMENVEQFKKIYDINEATKKDIANLTAALEALKEKIYSKDMLQLDKNSVLHKDGRIGFSDRWELINALAVKQGVSYTKYENLSKLVESLKLEKGIDFRKANNQRDALIDVLSKKMAKQELEQLVLKSLSFKMNKISQAEYYVFLQALASRYGIDPEAYRDLIEYTEYITLYESIDLIAIFEEVREFEDSVKEKLFTNDYQRKLYSLSRFVSLVKDLYELKLTNGDIEELTSSLRGRDDSSSLRGAEGDEAISTSGIASFIKDASLKYGVTIAGDYDISAILDNISPALAFYRTAEERNSAMLANTIKDMQKNGQTVAALITGGYHTKGLTNILKQKETSYIVILPKFDLSKPERPYVAILTNKKEPYEELLETGNYSLISGDYLKDSLVDPKQAQNFIIDAVMTSLGQAAIEHRDIESVKKLWVSSYTAAYDSLKSKGIIKEPISTPGVEKVKVFTLPEPIYRAIVKNEDGTIENRQAKPRELERFRQRMKTAGAAAGAQTISIEDRLAKLETATKEMLVESINDGMNEGNVKEDFEEEFTRVAGRKQAYKSLAKDEQDLVKAAVHSKFGMGDKQLAVTSQEPPAGSVTPQNMAQLLGPMKAVLVGDDTAVVELPAEPAKQIKKRFPRQDGFAALPGPEKKEPPIPIMQIEAEPEIAPKNDTELSEAMAKIKHQRDQFEEEIIIMGAKGGSKLSGLAEFIYKDITSRRNKIVQDRRDLRENPNYGLHSMKIDMKFIIGSSSAVKWNKSQEIFSEYIEELKNLKEGLENGTVTFNEEVKKSILKKALRTTVLLKLLPGNRADLTEIETAVVATVNEAILFKELDTILADILHEDVVNRKSFFKAKIADLQERYGPPYKLLFAGEAYGSRINAIKLLFESQENIRGIMERLSVAEFRAMVGYLQEHSIRVLLNDRKIDPEKIDEAMVGNIHYEDRDINLDGIPTIMLTSKPSSFKTYSRPGFVALPSVEEKPATAKKISAAPSPFEKGYLHMDRLRGLVKDALANAGRADIKEAFVMATNYLSEDGRTRLDLIGDMDIALVVDSAVINSKEGIALRKVIRNEFFNKLGEAFKLYGIESEIVKPELTPEILSLKLPGKQLNIEISMVIGDSAETGFDNFALQTISDLENYLVSMDQVQEGGEKMLKKYLKAELLIGDLVDGPVNSRSRFLEARNKLKEIMSSGQSHREKDLAARRVLLGNIKALSNLLEVLRTIDKNTLFTDIKWKQRSLIIDGLDAEEILTMAEGQASTSMGTPVSTANLLKTLEKTARKTRLDRIELLRSILKEGNVLGVKEAKAILEKEFGAAGAFSYSTVYRDLKGLSPEFKVAKRVGRRNYYYNPSVVSPAELAGALKTLTNLDEDKIRVILAKQGIVIPKVVIAEGARPQAPPVALPQMPAQQIAPEEKQATPKIAEKFIAKQLENIRKAVRKEIDALIQAGIMPDFEKLDVQIEAAQKLAEGSMYLIPMGFGKTVTLRLAAYILATAKDKKFKLNNEKGTLICTANDDLAKRDAEAAGKILSEFGITVGYVDSKDDGYIFDRKTGRLKKTTPVKVYKAADIIYGTVDKFVHRYENEELARNKADRVFSARKYFMLFDEADEALIYQIMTPFIISGREKEGAAKVIEMYKLARELAMNIYGSDDKGIKAGLIDISKRAQKKVSLTGEGASRLKALLGQQEGLMERTGLGSDIRLWKRLVEQALSVELCYNENGALKDYEIAGNEIVIKDETSGKLKPGTRWSMGLHTAIEVKHMKDGVLVRPEQATINTKMLKTFLDNKNLIEDFAGASGTMDEEFMLKVYRKKVEVPHVAQSARIDTVYMFTGEKSKWSAFYKDAVENILINKPVLIKVEEGMSEEVKNHIRDLIGKDRIIRIFDASSETGLADIEKEGGKPGAITIVTNRGGRGVDITLSELTEDLKKDGLVAYSTYIDELDATDTQFRGRTARRGEAGAFKAYWSTEDKLFARYKDVDAVKTALNAIKEEFTAKGDPIKVDKDSRSQAVVDLVASMRRAIMDQRIQQFEQDKDFEKEIESSKARILKLREAVLADKVNVADKERMLSIFDSALSTYLDTVIKAKHDLFEEMGVMTTAAQADAYVKFKDISLGAYNKAISGINAAGKKVIDINTILRKITGYGFGGLLVALSVWAISFVMKGVSIMQQLARGNNLAEMFKNYKILNYISTNIYQAMPSAFWIAAAIVLVIAGITLYQTYIKKFMQEYKGQKDLAILLRGTANFQEGLRAVLSIPVSILLMLSSILPAGALLALISMIAFPATAAMILPIASGMAAAGVAAGAMIVAFNFRKLQAAKLAQPGNIQRAARSLILGLTYLTAYALILKFVPGLSLVIPSMAALLGAGIFSYIFTTSQYDKALEKSKPAMRAKAIGFLGSEVVFALALGLAHLIGSAAGAFIAMTAVGSMLIVATTVLYAIAVPYVASRFAAVESQAVGVKASALAEMVELAAPNARGILMGSGAVTTLGVLTIALANGIPVMTVISAALAVMSISIFGTAGFLSYRKKILADRAKGKEPKGGMGVFLAAVFGADNKKIVQTLMRSVMFTAAVPSLGAGAMLNPIASYGKSMYEANTNITAPQVAVETPEAAPHMGLAPPEATKLEKMPTAGEKEIKVIPAMIGAVANVSQTAGSPPPPPKMAETQPVPVNFLSTVKAPAAAVQLTQEQEKQAREVLNNYFKDAFHGMNLLLSEQSGLPIDKGRIIDGEIEPLQTTTSPTNIGMALLQYVAGRDMKIVTEGDARNAVSKMLKTIAKIEKHKSGLFYAWYEANAGTPYATDRYVPSIDNANLTTALKIIAQAYKNDNTADGKEIAKTALSIIDSQDYSAVYGKEKGLLVGGITREGNKETWYPAGTLGSESRANNQVIAALGKIDKLSTLNSDIEIRKYRLATGEDIPVLATWDGGAFQMFMPNILVGEDSNPVMRMLLKNYTRAMEDQGKTRNILGMGIAAAHSACETALEYNGGQGITVLAQNADALPSSPRHSSWQADITPHALFLAGTVNEEMALENLGKLRDVSKGSYATGFGFMDSVSAVSKTPTKVKLALDEGMIIASIYKMVDGRGLSKYLKESDIGAKLNEILAAQDEKLRGAVEDAGFDVKALLEKEKEMPAAPEIIPEPITVPAVSAAVTEKAAPETAQKAAKPKVTEEPKTTLQAAEDRVENIKEEKRKNEIGRLSTIIDSDTMALDIYNELSDKRLRGWLVTKDDVTDAIQKIAEESEKKGFFDPIAKERLIENAQAIADELNIRPGPTILAAKAMQAQKRFEQTDIAIAESIDKAPGQPTVKKMPYGATNPRLLGKDEEYTIEYSTFRKPFYARGNGFLFTNEGTDSGIFNPKDISAGEEKRGFRPKGTPYAILKRKSDGWIRILHTVNDIKTLQQKGWKFGDERELSYADLTMADIFIRSLHNIDTPNRLVDIASQRGIIATAGNKPQVDLIMQFGLPGMARVGLEMRLPLRNPQGKVIEEIAIQDKEMQKLLRAESVQDLLRIIYELQARYIQAQENIKNIKLERDCQLETLKQALENERKGTEEGAVSKAREELLKSANKLENYENLKKDSEDALKELMGLESSDVVTLSSDFTAVKDIEKSPKEYDKKTLQAFKELKVEEGAGSAVVLRKKKEAEREVLDNKLIRARKKTHINFKFRLMVGPDSLFGSIIWFEFHRDKVTDPQVSLQAALNAMDEYEELVRDTEVRKALLDRELDRILDRMDEKQREAQAAKDIMDDAQANYGGPEQKIIQDQLNIARQNHASALEAIEQARKDFNDMLEELHRLTNGLTTQTTQLDEKFKLNPNTAKVLEEMDLRIGKEAQVDTYKSTMSVQTVQYAKDRSGYVNRTRNNTLAQKRAREAQLAQIGGGHANQLKKSLKARQAIEEDVQKLLKDNPENPEIAIAYFDANKKAYSDIQSNIDKEVSRLLAMIEEATQVGGRATLKVEVMEGPDMEIQDFAQIGGKVRLKVGKAYYGKISLLNANIASAENEEKRAINIITDRFLKSCVTLVDIADVINNKKNYMETLETEQLWANALYEKEPTEANAKTIKDLELEHIRTESLLKDLQHLSNAALTEHKMILGLDPQAKLDITGLLAIEKEEDFDKKTKDILAAFYDEKQPTEILDIGVNKFIALNDIAREGKGIPAGLAVNAAGGCASAEILNMREWTDVKTGKVAAETALKKSKNIREESRIELYHEMLISVTNNEVAEEITGRVKENLNKAKDYLSTEEAKNKTTQDWLRADKQVVQLEGELIPARRNRRHTFINRWEKNPETLSKEFKKEVSQPKENIALDMNAITAADDNAALDLEAAQKIAKITKDTSLLSGISFNLFISGTSMSSLAAGQGIGGYSSHPVYGTLGSSPRPPRQAQEGSATAVSPGEGGFNIDYGIRMNYLVNELFKKDVEIAEENVALKKAHKREADFGRKLEIVQAALTVAQRHANALHWKEAFNVAEEEKKLTRSPYLPPIDKESPAGIESMADNFHTVAVTLAKEEEVGRLALNSALKKANADVVISGILDKYAPNLAPELQEMFITASINDPAIEALKYEESIAELGVKDTRTDRLFPKIRLEMIFSASVVERSIEIVGNARGLAREDIAKLNKQNIEKLKNDTMREIKFRAEGLLSDLQSALESLERSEELLIIAENEYLAKKAASERRDDTSQDLLVAAEKNYRIAGDKCIKDRYQYRKLYAATRLLLEYYGVKEEDIISAEKSYIESLAGAKAQAPAREEKNPKLELQRADLRKLMHEKQVAERMLAEELNRTANRREPSEEEKIKNEDELRKKMMKNSDETGQAIKSDEWENIHAPSVQIRETYSQGITTLLELLEIPCADNRALNFNDWVDLLETYRNRHNIPENEEIWKLQLMAELYKDRKAEVDALATRDFKTILYEKHYKAYITKDQAKHLNDYKIKGEIKYDYAEPVNFKKIGFLSYIASKAMAKHKDTGEDVKTLMTTMINDIMKYEGQGGIAEREHAGQKLTNEESNKYFNWLIETAIDIDNQELSNLPPNSEERIVSANEVHKIIEEVFGDQLAIFGDNTERGKLEVWSIYRLITRTAQAGDRRDSYDGLRNSLAILKEIVTKDKVGASRLYGNWTPERLARLDHAAFLRKLIEDRKRLLPQLKTLELIAAPDQNERYQVLSEELASVNDMIDREVKRLKDGELYGIGVYFVTYALELPENRDLLEASSTRPLTEDEIERMIAPVRKMFEYLAELKPDIEKAYDFRDEYGNTRPFDVDNKDDMGTLSSFYDLAKAQDDPETPEDESWTVEESKIILQRIAKTKEIARQMFARLHSVNTKDIVFGPKRENTYSVGFLFAFGTDVFVNSYSWKEFFNEDSSVKDADKIERLLLNLPRAKDEAENLLRAIVNKNITLNLKDPQDSGFLINWVRQRVADGWDHTVDISDTYIFTIQSPKFARYLKELGVSDNFRQELAKSFLGIKNAENRDRHYDLMGRVSYFANGWRTKEDVEKELDYRLDKISQFKDYFAKKGVDTQSIVAAFSDIFKKFNFAPVKIGGEKIDNHYDVSKFFYMLKREVEVKEQGKRWSDKLIDKEEKKFETTFFEGNILSFARFIDIYDMSLDTFMEDFESLFRDLQDYPMDLEIGDKPIVELQMYALKKELERNGIKVDSHELKQIFLENQKQSMAMFWLKHMCTEAERPTLKRVKDKIRNRKIVWKAVMDKRDKIGTAINASQVGFLADLYGNKSVDIDRIFFDRAIFIQDLARKNLRRELLFEGLIPWVSLHRLNVDMPPRSQFGKYETLPEQRMGRTFSDTIQLDPDKAYLRTLDDERFRLVIWKGSSQLRKDLIGDREAGSFWMSLLNKSAEDKANFNNLLDCGSATVSDFRNIIFDIKRLMDPGRVASNKEDIQRLIVRRLLTRRPTRELTESERDMKKDEFIKYLIEKLKVRHGVISKALEYADVNYDIAIKEMLGKDAAVRLSKLDKKEEIKAIVTDTTAVYSALRTALGRDPDINLVFDAAYDNRTNGNIDKILYTENEILDSLISDLAGSNTRLLNKEEMHMSDQGVVNYWIKEYSLEDYMLSGKYDLRRRFIHALETRLVERKELKTLLADLGVIVEAVKNADKTYSKATWAMDLKDPDTMNLIIILLDKVKALGLESSGIINVKKERRLTENENKKIEDFNGAIEYECRAEAEHEMGILVRMKAENKTRIEIVSDLEKDKVAPQLKIRNNWFNWILGGGAIGIAATAIYAHLTALRQRKSARTPVTQLTSAGGASPEGGQAPFGQSTKGNVSSQPNNLRQEASPNALSGFPASLIFYLSIVLLQAMGIGLIYMKTFDWANVSPAFSVIMILAYIWLNVGNAIVMTDRIATKIKNKIKPLNKENYKNGVPRDKRTAIMITTLAQGDGFTLTLENEIARTLLKNRDNNIIAIIYDASSLDNATMVADQLRRVDLIRTKYGLTNAQLLYFHRGSAASLNMDEQGDIINLDKKFGSLTDMMRFLGDGVTHPTTEYEAYTGRTLKRAVFLVSGLSGILATLLTVPFTGLIFGMLVGISASSFVGFVGALVTSGATSRRARVRGTMRDIQDARIQEPLFDAVDGDLTALGFTTSNFTDLCELPEEGRFSANKDDKLWGLFLLDDKNFAGDTIAEAIRIMVKTLLIHSKRGRIETNLEQKAEEIMARMEAMSIISLATDPNNFAAADDFNFDHLNDIKNHLINEEHFNRQDVTDLRDFLENVCYHYQPIRKAIEVLAHPDQDFAAFGNVWIDGPNVDIRRQSTQSIWEYWMWNAAKSGQFFEISMQMFTKRASIYGKGLVVIDRYLNPKKIKQEKHWGLFLVGLTAGAVLGYAGACLAGWGGVGAFIGLFMGATLGAFEGRFHRGAFGAGYTGELSHDFFEADNAASIHTRIAGIYEPGAKNYIEQKDERALFRWFMGVLLYFRHNFGPGITMADRWINYLAQRMYFNEVIFFIWTMGTLLLGPVVSGSVDRLLFGPRLLEFTNPLIMFSLLVFMWFQIIFLPNIIFKDKGSLISRRQMIQKVIVTTAIFMNNVAEGTKYLIKNIPRVLIYGTHPRFTAKEIPLWKRAIIAFPALIGGGIIFLSYIYPAFGIAHLTALIIGTALFAVSYMISRAMKLYVPGFWIVAGLVIGALFVCIPILISAHITIPGIITMSQTIVSGILHPILPHLTPELVGQAAKAANGYVAALLNNLPAFKHLFYLTRLIFTILTLNPPVMIVMIKAIGVFIIIKAIARTLQIMKEPMPWKGTLAQRGSSKVPLLYRVAQNINLSFMIALITITASVFITSNLWPLVFASPLIYSWSLGYMHIWYTAKPMWYEGGPEQAEGQYTVRTGFIGFLHSLPKAIASDFIATWNSGVKDKNLAPLIRAKHFVSLLINGAFVVGTLLGVVLMFVVLGYSVVYLISALPMPAVSTFWEISALILQYVLGSFTAALILPQLLSYIIAFPFIILEWL